MAEIRIELQGAFAHQEAFLNCKKRYVVACSGTKAGKSVAGGMYAVVRLTEKANVRGCWIAPTFHQSTSIGLEAVRGLLPRELVDVRLSGVPKLTLANGSSIEFKSADQPDNLYGAAYDFAVVDEAGRCSEDAWNAIRSTLTPTSGPCRLLSNPTGRTGWFFALYSRGLSGDDADVASYRWRTSDNPLIPTTEIDDARRNLSESAFRSLYEGEFLDVGGSVFRNIRQAATGVLKPPEPGRRYIGGLDLARTVDWTVATIIDVEAGEVVAWERWHGASWEMSVGRVLDLSTRYNRCKFNVDSTGLGDVVLETLERVGVPVEGVKFTNSNKAQMVERLAGLIEKGKLRFPPLDVLLAELEAFEGKTGPTGTVVYGSPSGQHDDAAVSLYLATKDLDVEDRPPLYAAAIPIWGGGATLHRNLPPVPAGMSRPLGFGRPHGRGF